MVSKYHALVTVAAPFAVVYAQNVTTYAPRNVQCPTQSLFRLSGTPQANNQTLNPDEVSYVSSRKQLVKANIHSWLGDKLATVYGGNLDSISPDQLPNLAVSLSGGNFRAALFGAAALEAFDSRNATSVGKGLGGLLQSSTYITALSGGSYTLSSLIFNEFPTLNDLVFGSSTSGLPGWQLDQNLFQPGPNGNYTNAFLGHIIEDLAAKRAAGNFPVTFCDMWGRALAYHFLPGTTPDTFTLNTTAGNHAASLTYSSATNLNSWKNFSIPFPIIIANVNSPNAKGKPFGNTGTLPLTSVVYEITPLEFGSYDPQLATFLPLQYLGSTIKNGLPSACVTGFDNAGLMIGTSSCDFNIFNVTNDPAWTSPQGFQPLIAGINSTFGTYQPGQELDVTSVPNPFFGVNAGTYQDSNETSLSLLDGSLDVENDPILPLLVKKRAVDVIVVLDSSGETSEYKPNGLSLLATKEKAAVLPAGTINFPVPFPNTTDEFISLGLNTRPVFFGCDGANNTDDAFPLLVYIPNDDPTGVTNITTSTLQISVANQSLIFGNSYSLVNRGFVGKNNADLSKSDDQWSTCVACAVVERARARQNIARTSACNACFSRYCFTAQNLTSTSTSSSKSGVGRTAEVGLGFANGATLIYGALVLFLLFI